MLKLSAAGDIILMGALPRAYHEISAPLVRFLADADIRTANMETTLTAYDHFASTFCGGTWLSAPASILTELETFGFHHYSFANNHSMDYSYGGLIATLETLAGRGLQASGAGCDLAEASQHRLVDSPAGRAAFISITATADPSAKAGLGHGPFPGRPGVNRLDHEEVFTVRPEQMKALEAIAAATRINGRLDNSKRGGYTPTEPGIFNLGPIRFAEGGEPGKMTRPREADCLRVEAAIRAARQEADVVVVSCHSHEIKGASDEEPDYFLEEFARRCIDQGASALICSGTHQIKAVEIYRGAPIFYSVANFIFRSDQVAELPLDFYEKYQVPPHYSAREALAVRSAKGTRGLQTDRSNYLGLVPALSFDRGRLAEITVAPVELCFDLGPDLKGLPRLAEGPAFDLIYQKLKTLSGPYGTSFRRDQGLIRIDL